MAEATELIRSPFTLSALICAAFPSTFQSGWIRGEVEASLDLGVERRACDIGFADRPGSGHDRVGERKPGLLTYVGYPCSRLWTKLGFCGRLHEHVRRLDGELLDARGSDLAAQIARGGIAGRCSSECRRSSSAPRARCGAVPVNTPVGLPRPRLNVSVPILPLTSMPTPSALPPNVAFLR